MRPCPSCRQSIANNAVACNHPGCGWEAPRSGAKAQGPASWTCADEREGQRCAELGTMATSTTGGGPWFCAKHFPPFRGMMRAKEQPDVGTLRHLRSLTHVAPVIRPLDFEANIERIALQEGA